VLVLAALVVVCVEFEAVENSIFGKKAGGKLAVLVFNRSASLTGAVGPETYAGAF
jgi:hypothetical protein